MMLSQTCRLLVCWTVLGLPTLILMTSRVSLADEPNPPTVAKSGFDFEAAADQFREVVVSKALETIDEEGGQALNIAIEKRFVDNRFNVVGDLLREALESDEPKESDVLRFIRTLRISTLDVKTKVELMLETRSRRFRNPFENEIERLTSSQLQELSDPLRKALLERLKDRADINTAILTLPLLDGDGSEFMPFLFAIAKEGDMTASGLAMQQIDRYLDEFRERERRVKEESGRYLAYAERIFFRLDKNRDGELTEDEWKSMLMDPSESDANKDGSITLKEYAVWIENKNRK